MQIVFVEPASMLDGLTEKFCLKKSDVVSLSDRLVMPDCASILQLLYHFTIIV